MSTPETRVFFNNIYVIIAKLPVHIYIYENKYVCKTRTELLYRTLNLNIRSIVLQNINTYELMV